MTKKKKGDTESQPVFPQGPGDAGGLPNIPDTGSSIADPLPLELFQDAAPPEPAEIAAAAPRHVLFGEIAVQEKYVTPAQLEECLQIRAPPPAPAPGTGDAGQGFT